MLVLCLPLPASAPGCGSHGRSGGCQPRQRHRHALVLTGVFSHDWFVVCFSLSLEEELGLREAF